ncbi:MAG TPA: prepilin-type N-terminal cleavage/methylation domain-containing protein [Longimicrobiaceae bacterium]|nr:prepilin-type N-terminal cleavage/methylation domain-containing protein [Longimicrobiaceae bacterium]
MRNEPARLRSTDGFTLVEVLAAMMILAVGMLGLEALGIGASRLIVRAEKESRVSTLAATQLERALREVRANPAVRTYCPVQATGEDQVCVAVATISGAANTRRVTVTVTPKPGGVPLEPFVVSSSVYDPAIP